MLTRSPPRKQKKQKKNSPPTTTKTEEKKNKERKNKHTDPDHPLYPHIVSERYECISSSLSCLRSSPGVPFRTFSSKLARLVPRLFMIICVQLVPCSSHVDDGCIESIGIYLVLFLLHSNPSIKKPLPRSGCMLPLPPRHNPIMPQMRMPRYCDEEHTFVKLLSSVLRTAADGCSLMAGWSVSWLAATWPTCNVQHLGLQRVIVKKVSGAIVAPPLISSVCGLFLHLLQKWGFLFNYSSFL